MHYPKTVIKPLIYAKSILWVTVFILFSNLSYSFAAENPVGTIIGISGTIEYYSSGNGESVAEAKPGEVQRVSFKKWEKARFHQAVYAKDKFRTARKSRLKILLADKSLIALGPNSEMKVESYLYNKNEKLRQGVIGLVHGFSMYIVNKSQTNKKSSFKMVTPTANLSARGTQGYVAFSPKDTYTANKAGNLLTSNVDPDIPGIMELGRMMGNNVPVDGPPTPARPVSPETMKNIEKIVMGLTGGDAGNGLEGGGGPLIETQESEEDGGEMEKETTFENGKTEDQMTTLENGKTGKQDTEFFEGFFAPENNPFPDVSEGENFMTTCTK